MKNTNFVLPFLGTLHAIAILVLCILGVLFWIFSPLFTLHLLPHIHQNIEQEIHVQHLHPLAQQLVRQLEHAYTTSRTLVTFYCSVLLGLITLFIINIACVHQVVLRTSTAEKHLPHLGHGVVFSFVVLLYVMVSYPSTPIFSVPAYVERYNTVKDSPQLQQVKPSVIDLANRGTFVIGYSKFQMTIDTLILLIFIGMLSRNVLFLNQVNNNRGLIGYPEERTVAKKTEP